MEKITKYQIESARILFEAIEKKPDDIINPAHLKPIYRNWQNNISELQKWVKDEYTVFLNLCENEDARQSLKTLIQEPSNLDSIISNITAFIALCAVVPTPDYKLFTIYDDPDQKIINIIGLYSQAFKTAKKAYSAEAYKAGADTATAQTTAGTSFSNNIGNSAVSGNTAYSSIPGNSAVKGTAYKYQAIPAQYVVSGNKSTRDYMQELSNLGYYFRLNEATAVIEVNGKPKTDSLESEIVLSMSDKGYKGRKIIEDCWNVLAEQNKYNPIKDYFNSLSWDGVTVLDQFVTLLSPTDPIFAGILFRKWMISVVAKIMDHIPNSMLVLEGRQGSGKSTLAKWLCPLPDYYMEGQIKPDDKDYKGYACSKLLWEVGELGSTTRRADQESLKAFLTTHEFTYRPSYGHNSITRPHLASYIGTVNNSSGFLFDVTGNRRFWTIGTGDIDFSYGNLYNVNDLWAEAVARWKQGESYTLTADESKNLSEKQDDYRTVNPAAEAIKRYFYIDPDNSQWILTFSELKEKLQDKCKLSPAELSANKIGDAITELGIKRGQKRLNGSKSASKIYIGLKEINP